MYFIIFLISGGSEEEEVLRRQIARYHARCTGMEELVSTYRTGVIALYSDGSSYGAAQYAQNYEKKNMRGSNDSVNGTNPMHNKSVMNNSKNYCGWIEREITNIKNSYVEEMKLLEVIGKNVSSLSSLSLLFYLFYDISSMLS